VLKDVAENSLPGQLFIHFGLRENPFGVTPDIRFLYQSHTHREALVSLGNGIDFGFGFQVLIGQPGMGKTSLLFNLLEEFRTAAHTAFLFQPQSEPHELLQSVLYELGTNSAETSLRKLFEQVNEVLYRAARQRKRVILVVDEAQNLDYVVLEALRQLSNFETPDSKLMQVVLAGQPQLAEKLATSTHEQLRQRISAISRLRPLGLDETAAYINHRLATAGYSGADLFTEEGVRLIWNHSKGVPRNINTLCFAAMVLGFAEGAKSIDERILQEAVRDLDLNSALADVFEMEPLAAVSRGDGKVQPTRKITVETDDAIAVVSEEPVASAGSSPQEVETFTVSADSSDRIPDGASEYVPPSVVEALARITQALEEHRLLLIAKSDTLSQPLPASPVIPSVTTATESAKSSASFDHTPPPPPSTALGSSSVSPTPDGRTAKPETNSPAAKKRSESRIVMTKALSFAAFAGILAFMLVEKFPLHSGTVKAGARGSSALVQNNQVQNNQVQNNQGQNNQPANYSAPAQSPASLIVGPGSPGTNAVADFHHPRGHSSEQSQEVVVRTFPTDLGATSKTSENKQELRRIFFDEDSATIDSQYRPWLQQLADALAKDPAAMISLEGHTDGRGPEAHNLALSSRRAIAVRNALVRELHVPEARLTATGVGSGAPLQPNSSATGRAYNRRVEIRLKHSSN